MKPFNKDKAKKVIDNLLSKHNITVVKWSAASCGWASLSDRTIKIPMPTNIDRFCVGLHEIGHVVQDATKRKMKLYQSEYIAETYAISECEKVGFDASEYAKRARGYITMCIAKGHNRGLKSTEIEDCVKEFCGVDFNTWSGKKVFVSNWAKEIKITIYEH